MKSELQCYRKHILRDQIYDIYIDDTKMILQHFNDPPKYTLPLTWSLEISWNLYGDEFAFGLKTNNKYKWFYAKPTVILQLKTLLCKYVAFKNFQQFYQPGPHIAIGTTSTVYQLTRKSDDNSNFVVKCTLKDKADLNKLHQQLNILRQLDHPNLPKFVEFYSGDETYYTILEQIKGLSLSQIIKESKSALNIPLIQKIMSDLLYALLCLQNNKIIHRDIRPENIIFDHKSQQKKTKLVHFQFACVIGTNQKIQGTPGYIAPEVLNGNHFGPESDMFSLGCVFYKLLVKKDLFQGQNKGEVLSENKKCQINLQNLSLIRIPQTAQSLLAEMLRVEPKLRIKVSEAINHSFFKTTTQFSARNLSLNSKVDKNSVFRYSQFQPSLKQEDDIQLDDYFTNELPPTRQIPIMKRCKGGHREYDDDDDIESIHSRKSRMRVSKSTG